MNETRRNEPNSLSSALAGAMLGAGLAIVGAMALKDENIKNKVKKVIDDLLAKTDEKVTEAKTESGKTKEEITEVASEKIDEVDKKLSEDSDK